MDALDLDTATLSLALTVCFVIEPSPPGDVTPAYGSGKWWRSLSWCSMETREYINSNELIELFVNSDRDKAPLPLGK